MKIADLMTQGVASVPSDASLAAAAQLMWDCDCGVVPVNDSEGRTIGMITDRDICMATWSRDRAPSSICVADAMSRELYFCSPNDSLSTAESLMRSKQIRRIPILDEQRTLVGLLSLADVARHGAASNTRRAGGELAPDQIALTLADICSGQKRKSDGASAAG